MKHWSRHIVWTLFFIALAVLVAVAIAAFVTTSKYARSERWVSHTREVQTQLAEVESNVYNAEAARLSYLVSNDPSALSRYYESSQEIPYQWVALDNLMADNPEQRQRLAALRPLVSRRLGVLQESIALIQGGKSNSEEQNQLTLTGAQLTSEIMKIVKAMGDEEAKLLAVRETVSERTYERVRMALTVSFAAVLLLLSAIFFQLLMELRERRLAEAAVRRLSARILQVQDAERRRVARELHDSLGQLLVGLKLNLSQLEAACAGGHYGEVQEIVTSSLKLADEGLTEARTLSHLLHPPLLEELGFASAAKWYVKGFSQRSSVNVSCEIAANLPRMPEEMELALFRVLQEALTNIHKHSGSATAEVSVETRAREVVLTVTDHGKGIPAERLEEFRRTRSGVGVGLAGMRERVNELGGTMELLSEGRGSVLRVRLPLVREEEKATSGPAMPVRGVEMEGQEAENSREEGRGILLEGNVGGGTCGGW